MLVGFVFWYRGLALGGIAGVGQLQLLQPLFGLALAGLLLHEPVAWTMLADRPDWSSSAWLAPSASAERSGHATIGPHGSDRPETIRHDQKSD